MKKILRLVCLFLALLGLPCFAADESAASKGASLMSETIPTISPADLEAKIEKKEKMMILDVRQPDEHAASAIEGSLLIPLSTLPERFAELPKDRPVYVYCRSGARSARAVAFLMNEGFTNVYSMSGGMLAWAPMMQAKGDKASCKTGSHC